LNTTEDNVVARIQQLQQDLSDARKQVDGLQRKLARHDFKEMVTQTENINGKTALLATLDNVPVDTMREMADWFRTEVPENGVMVLGSDIQGKPMLLVALTDDLVKAGMKAGNLIKPIAAVVGGGGGGRPNMAQAGGKDSAKLPEAIDKAREILSDA
jgi:alanyl-tRNA synthetase